MAPSPPQQGGAENKAQEELEENGQPVVADVEGGEYSFLYLGSLLLRVTRLR